MTASRRQICILPAICCTELKPQVNRPTSRLVYVHRILQLQLNLYWNNYTSIKVDLIISKQDNKLQ